MLDNRENDDDPNEVEEQELEEVAETPIEVVYDQGSGYVSIDNADKISQQGFYGVRKENGALVLNVVEILHLLERKRIVVVSRQGVSLTSKDIINDVIIKDSEIWVKYLVFRDLRSRGYAVRQGIGGGITFRVYARGDKPGSSSANQLVFVMREGIPISLTDLDLVIQAASAARKKLVFALVDQNGEVNYYKVAQIELMNKRGVAQ